MDTYTGGCHCGNVRYEVDIAELTSAISCNCSICRKRGWLLTFAPISNFRLLIGEEHLTEYLFNKKLIHHLFCANCGVASFGRGMGPGGQEMAAINVRCLDNVNTDTLTIENYNGKDM